MYKTKLMFAGLISCFMALSLCGAGTDFSEYASSRGMDLSQYSTSMDETLAEAGDAREESFALLSKYFGNIQESLNSFSLSQHDMIVYKKALIKASSAFYSVTAAQRLGLGRLSGADLADEEIMRKKISFIMSIIAIVAQSLLWSAEEVEEDSPGAEERIFLKDFIAMQAEDIKALPKNHYPVVQLFLEDLCSFVRPFFYDYQFNKTCSGLRAMGESSLDRELSLVSIQSDDSLDRDFHIKNIAYKLLSAEYSRDSFSSADIVKYYEEPLAQGLRVFLDTILSECEEEPPAILWRLRADVSQLAVNFSELMGDCLSDCRDLIEKYDSRTFMSFFSFYL